MLIEHWARLGSRHTCHPVAQFGVTVIVCVLLYIAVFVSVHLLTCIYVTAVVRGSELEEQTPTIGLFASQVERNDRLPGTTWMHQQGI